MAISNTIPCTEAQARTGTMVEGLFNKPLRISVSVQCGMKSDLPTLGYLPLSPVRSPIRSGEEESRFWAFSWYLSGVLGFRQTVGSPKRQKE